jgi:hypothetical protein
VKYQCERGHIFIFPTTQHSGSELCWVELKSCPECNSWKISEYVEPQAEITSVKSVDLNEVDTYLKDGYIVEAMFAKTATVIKKEAPKVTVQNPDPDDNQTFQEQAKDAYSKIPEKA